MRLILLALMLGLVGPQAAAAQAVPIPRISHGLRFLSEFTLPSAWAGIWRESDSLFIGCDTRMLQNVSIDDDTLCAGEILNSGSGSNPLECTGSINDNSFDFTCTESSVENGCTVGFTSHFTGTRNGNTATTVSSVVIHYSPPTPCFNIPDSCTRIVTHSVRLGSAPAEFCTTPVEPTTWGTLKAVYR